MMITRLPNFSVYCFLEREKMDEILTEQNLKMLATVF